jgi:hypothetical protein
MVIKIVFRRIIVTIAEYYTSGSTTRSREFKYTEMLSLYVLMFFNICETYCKLCVLPVEKMKGKGKVK